MKKGPLLLLIGLLVIVAALFYFGKNRGSATETAATASPGPATPTEYNELPHLKITRPDGTELLANTLPGKTILVFFRPDCDHCQREAAEIKKNLLNFQDYQLYFISEVPMPEITAFGQEYGLLNEPKISFAHTEMADLLGALGSFSLPAIYIYGADKRLKKSFQGETSMGAILSAL